MRKPMWLLLVCAPLLAGAQTSPGQFDGTWTTTMACDASNYIPACTFKFTKQTDAPTAPAAAPPAQ
jgi:hypothetical protein